MMANLSVNLHCKVSFWVRPYIKMMAIYCALTGKSPDIQKMTQFIMDKGVSVCVKT